MRHLKIFLLLVLVVSLAANVVLWGKVREAREALGELKPHTIDIRFSQFMGIHHQQAIALSQLMLDGQPTGLAGIARRITGAQLRELGEMHGWLKLWGRPLQPDRDDMTWMLLGQQPYDAELLQYLIDCGNAPEGMPGLATQDQLQQLGQLPGGLERDRLFLRLMLAHHEGGLPMARFAAREAHLAPVRRLAGQVVLEQSREIQQLRSMLTLSQREVVAPDAGENHTGG